MYFDLKNFASLQGKVQKIFDFQDLQVTFRKAFFLENIRKFSGFQFPEA